MCGIVGIFDYGSGKHLVSESAIKTMTDEIRHRGPDDDGIFISQDHEIGLGFRRLSIIDLSTAGHQPMGTQDNAIWIVFNGEIYNHLEIRKGLELKGYKYRSKTDTETILYAYQEYGIEFISKLYGMFAIAIWDSHKGRLFLIRDRIGIKPLYYTSRNGALFFASEIKAILTQPDISREVNPQGLYDYLTFLTTPPNETLFKNIFKLEAGHYASIDRSGSITKEKYWDLNEQSNCYKDSDFNNENFCINNIRLLLRDSIKLRMMSDVPFGVMLSGGIDSSLNVALMSELMDHPIETFTVGYKDLEKYNELKYARQIAHQFKTNHHEILLDEGNLLDTLSNVVWHQDEPNADPVCVPMYFASKLAKDSGVTVVQVGEGSDEQFAGYKHYLREVRFNRYYYSLLPRFVGKISYNLFRRSDPYSLITDYARRLAENDSPFYGGAISFSEESKRQLLSNAYLATCKSSGRFAKDYNHQLEVTIGSQFAHEHLRRMIYYEFKSRLAELLLMRVDKMSMATSIEARVPFLDHRLVEFSFRIPEALKLKHGIPKYILKKAAEGIIPNDIIYRPKQGFSAPIKEWMRSGRLAKFANERIMESHLLKNDFFDKKHIAELFSRHGSGRGNFSGQLWTLLIVSMWHDIYISRNM